MGYLTSFSLSPESCLHFPLHFYFHSSRHFFFFYPFLFSSPDLRYARPCPRPYLTSSRFPSRTLWTAITLLRESEKRISSSLNLSGYSAASVYRKGRRGGEREREANHFGAITTEWDSSINIALTAPALPNLSDAVLRPCPPSSNRQIR